MIPAILLNDLQKEWDMREGEHTESRPRYVQMAKFIAPPALACVAIYAIIGLPPDQSGKPPGGSGHEAVSTAPPHSSSASPSVESPEPSAVTSTALPPETSGPATSTSVASSASSASPEVADASGCGMYFDTSTYRNREYELCTAYVVNSATLALQGMYKFGNNRFSIPADAAKHHFETRYFGQPRQTVEGETESWPETSQILGNQVEDSISVVSLTSSLNDDRGLIRTQESWRVIAPDGTVLYNEPLHVKDITMCRGRLPGHLLREWVVVDNSQIPDFDCIGFDRSNGLEP